MTDPQVTAVEIVTRLRETELGGALVGQAYCAIVAGKLGEENAQLRAKLKEAGAHDVGTAPTTPDSAAS